MSWTTNKRVGNSQVEVKYGYPPPRMPVTTRIITLMNRKSLYKPFICDCYRGGGQIQNIWLSKKYVNWTTLPFASKPPRDLKYCERIKVETTSFNTKTDQNGVSNGHGDVKLFMHISFFSHPWAKPPLGCTRHQQKHLWNPLELSEIFLKNHGSWNYTWNLFVLYFLGFNPLKGPFTIKPGSFGF